MAGRSYWYVQKKSVNRGGRFVIFLMARTAFITRFVTPKGIVSVIVNDGQLSIISDFRFAGKGASMVMTGQLVKLIGVKVEGKAEVEVRLEQLCSLFTTPSKFLHQND